MFKWTTIIALPLLALVTACGDKGSDDGDSGLGVPDSFVTDAQLTPGALIAYDAATVKSMVENDSSYTHNEPDDASSDTGACYLKAYEAIKVVAEGDELRMEGEADLAPCMIEEYKKGDGYAAADYSEFVVAAKMRFMMYVQCDGADLSAYNGKNFNDLKDVDECLTSASVSTISESSSTTSITGKIKGVVVDDTSFDIGVTFEDAYYNASRKANGKVCTRTLAGAEFTWDGCIDTSYSIKTKDKSGIVGSETDGDDIGKGTYEKKEYVGLKGLADKTSLWYTGGSYNVTLNDWTGTVKYTSATSEPIFEFKKGTETVTGTVKAPAAND